MKKKQTPKTGFTLIEMLVVIAIIALLASILIPAVTGAIKKADRIKVMTNGKGIYTGVFATITEVGVTRGSNKNVYYAEDGSSKYANSTEYFDWLMRDYDEPSVADGGAGRVLDQDLSVFAADGVPIADSLTDFEPENNTWSVVTELSAGSEASFPFLITRNLNEDALVDWGTDNSSRPASVGDGDDGSAGNYKNPYEDDAVIIIRAGGGGEVVDQKQLTWEVINPAARDSAGDRPTNVILEPHS